MDIPDTWSMVPQIMTTVGKFTDLALERYRTQKDGTKYYIPSFWLEFKSALNATADIAVKQLLDSIRFKRGDIFSREGYLLGVQGKSWLFMEYNVVIIREGKRTSLSVIAFPFIGNDTQLERR